jgi:hypothetical protein
MSTLVKALIALSALAFVLAEAYSRASTNLALLAIALVLLGRADGTRPV